MVSRPCPAGGRSGIRTRPCAAPVRPPARRSGSPASSGVRVPEHEAAGEIGVVGNGHHVTAVAQVGAMLAQLSPQAREAVAPGVVDRHRHRPTCSLRNTTLRCMLGPGRIGVLVGDEGGEAARGRDRSFLPPPAGSARFPCRPCRSPTVCRRRISPLGFSWPPRFVHQCAATSCSQIFWPASSRNGATSSPACCFPRAHVDLAEELGVICHGGEIQRPADAGLDGLLPFASGRIIGSPCA